MKKERIELMEQLRDRYLKAKRALFDKVYSIEDFSMVKSDTAIYLATAERIGASVSDCVFVDDNEIAVSTSKAAGMYAVGVYDESSRDRRESITAIADTYAVTFAELPIF